jgi:hypothetical protein
MYLDQNIKINSMADAARKTFDSTDARLEEIESNFYSKMRGRTMGGVIGSFFGTALWLVAFGFAAFYCQGYVDNTLLMVTIGVIALFMLVMFIDDAMNFKFFGKVSSYGSNVSQLRTRVRVGRDSISQNKESFMNASGSGWDYILEIGESIPDEANAIEGTLSSMDSLKTGFLSNAKLWLLYASVIMVAIVGSMFLFSPASNFIYDLFDGDVSGDLLNAVCWIGLIIACVGSCIIAKWIWSQWDCNVDNLTIFSVFVGPILFIALECLGALIVWVVIMVVAFVIALAGLALCIFCVSAMCGG